MEDCKPEDFVGNTLPNSYHIFHANRLQSMLKFSFAGSRNLIKVNDILKYLITRLKAPGVLVMVSVIVDSGTRRKLDLLNLLHRNATEPISKSVAV